MNIIPAVDLLFPPNRREQRHIVFGADPIGVRVASFLCVSSENQRLVGVN